MCIMATCTCICTRTCTYVHAYADPITWSWLRAGTAAGAGMPGVALLPERQLVSTGVGRGAAMKEQLVLHVLDPNE